MEIYGIRHNINFRDLGGYSTPEGIVRSGIIYRSGGLWQMSEAELQIVQDLHLRTILDIRAEIEQEYRPDPVIPGADSIRVSAMTDGLGEGIDFSINGIKRLGAEGLDQLQKMRAYYQEMPYGNKAIACLFDILLAERLPVLVLCCCCAWADVLRIFSQGAPVASLLFPFSAVFFRFPSGSAAVPAVLPPVFSLIFRPDLKKSKKVTIKGKRSSGNFFCNLGLTSYHCSARLKVRKANDKHHTKRRFHFRIFEN